MRYGTRSIAVRIEARRAGRIPMNEHSFTLIIIGDVDSHIDELFEAGCDDATFGAVDAVAYGEFDRVAPTFAEAVASGIAAVESIPGLRVIRVEPDDFVTAADIAARLGRSRESVRLLIGGKRGPGGFPAPVSHLCSKHRLWRWSAIANWLGEADEKTKLQARTIAALNAALELRESLPSLSPEDRALVAALERAS